MSNMLEHKFAIGDVVQLKSGGPPMTVGSLPTEHNPPYNGRVEVVFARNGRLRFDWVAAGALELVAEHSAEANQLQRHLEEEIRNSVRLSSELVQAKDKAEQLRRDLAKKEEERVAAYAACEMANTRTRDVEVARQQLVDDMTIVNGKLRDLRALAAKLIELDRDNLPIDVKSLIADARLALNTP